VRNIKCQSRDFLTELCCNTTIPLVSVVFIAWITTLIFKIDVFLNILVLVIYGCSIRVTAVLVYIEPYITEGRGHQCMVE